MPITAEIDAKDQQLVDDLLKSGRYASIDEIVKEGLEAIRWREADRAALHAAIERGLADADAGRLMSLEEAFDPLIAKYEAMAKQAAE